jgi:hypothetical protein
LDEPPEFIPQDMIQKFYRKCSANGIDPNNPESYFDQYERYPYKSPPTKDHLTRFINDIDFAFYQWKWPCDLEEMFREFEIYGDPWKNAKWVKEIETYDPGTGNREPPDKEPDDYMDHDSQPASTWFQTQADHLSLNTERGIEPVIPTLGRSLSEAL